MDDDDCVEEVEAITAKGLAICGAKRWFIFFLYSFITLSKHPGNLWRAICSGTSSLLSLPISGTKSLLVPLSIYVSIGSADYFHLVWYHQEYPCSYWKKWETKVVRIHGSQFQYLISWTIGSLAWRLLQILFMPSWTTALILWQLTCSSSPVFTKLIQSRCRRLLSSL